MHDENTKKPILLLGAYGRGNAGDDVFLHSALELFADRDVYINSADDSLLPPQFQGKVKTISTVSAGDFFKKLALYFRIKEVVYWGGDLWVELYGTRLPRILLYKMITLNTLLRLSGKKIYYVGVGIGRLQGLSLALARLSARMAKRVVVREKRSSNVIGLKNVEVLPDLAINLPYNQSRLHTKPTNRAFHVTVSILQSIPNPDINFPKLVTAVKELINGLPEDTFKVTLLPMHVSNDEPKDDLWASEQLKMQLTRSADMFEPRDLETIVKQLRESDLVIGTRLHTDILGMLNGTPSIGIAYRPKVKSLFEDNGIGEFCTDLDNLEVLPQMFNNIYEHYNEVAERFFTISQENLSKRADYKTLTSTIWIDDRRDHIIRPT